VRLLSTPLGASIVALREGLCSLAITAADIPDPRIELESLSIVSRAAVAAATHPLAIRAASGSTLTVFELADFTQIVAADPSPLTEGRDFGVLSPGTWCVTDNATKLGLIMAGVGWGSLPLWLIQRELAEGQLVRLPAAEFGREGETRISGAPERRTPRPRWALVPPSAAATRRWTHGEQALVRSSWQRDLRPSGMDYVA